MSAQTHMSDWYARFYTATQTSAAYSQYCSEVFGKDFSQHGYSDVTQINRILKSSNVKDGDIVECPVEEGITILSACDSDRFVVRYTEFTGL